MVLLQEWYLDVDNTADFEDTPHSSKEFALMFQMLKQAGCKDEI